MYFSDALGARIQRLEFNGTTPEDIVNTPFQSIGLYTKVCQHTHG